MRSHSEAGCSRRPRPLRGAWPARLIALLVLFALTGCGDDETEHLPIDAIAALVRSDQFQSLAFELDAVPGRAPYPEVQRDLVNELAGVIDKPGGIYVVQTDEITSRGSDYAWPPSELFSLAEYHYDLSVPSDTIKVQVLALDGHYGKDDPSTGNRTLGVAWDSSHIALFTQVIQESCSSLPLSDAVLRQVDLMSQYGVWLHEVGHVLGLVNLGAPMVTAHEDPAHPGHDVNEHCVMHDHLEQQSALRALQARFVSGDQAPFAFDQACLNDIAAVRYGR